MHEPGTRLRAGGGSLVLAALLMITPAVAADEPATPSPYAGAAASPIKALSPAEIEELLSGLGMGLAKAAELNHYPGPRHVLDLGDALGLSSEQRRETERLHAEMQALARELGRRLVAAEATLDALFAAGRADEATVAARVGEIARIQGELRLVHLNAHLAMRRLLDPAQIARYDRLRGYTAEAGAGHQHQHGG